MFKWRLWWGRVRDSLWFVPGAITTAAAALALSLVQLERAEHLPTHDDLAWLFGGGASAARELLGTIAGSLITVTGVVFSVTIVALQLASSQYSPRVLDSFIGDRPNQLVLGTMIGTFTYSLLVMRSIRSEADGRASFMPAMAVTLAIVFLLASVVALIYFINHAARSIRVEHIVERQLARARTLLDERFGEAALGARALCDAACPALPATPAAPIAARRSGYLQAVQLDAIVEAAAEHDALVALDRVTGRFVVEGEDIARAWPADRCAPALRDAVLGALVLGPQRTPEQDVEYALQGIVDVAVRALSPSVNDPTTAMLCVDRLGELVVLLARRLVERVGLTDDSGALRVVIRHPSFDRVADIAFGGVARDGAAQLPVVLHLLDTLHRIGPLVPPARRPALARAAVAAGEAGVAALPLAMDRARVADRLDRTLAWLGGAPGAAPAPPPTPD